MATNETQVIPELVQEARKVAGLSINALAKNSSIPYATMSRKLDGIGEFKFSEVLRIAKALNVHASSLLPDQLTSAGALAADGGQSV